MSITGTRTVASIIAGEPREGGRHVESRNPANLDEVVCEVLLGEADTFVDACRAARMAQPEWSAVPAPVRGRAIAVTAVAPMNQCAETTRMPRGRPRARPSARHARV